VAPLELRFFLPVVLAVSVFASPWLYGNVISVVWSDGVFARSFLHGN